MNKTDFIEYLKSKIDDSSRIDGGHKLNSKGDGFVLYWEDDNMNRGFYLEPRATGFRIEIRCWRPQVSNHKHYNFHSSIGRINVDNSAFVERIADELFEMAFDVEIDDLEKSKSRRATTTEIHWEGDDFKYVNEE